MDETRNGHGEEEKDCGLKEKTPASNSALGRTGHGADSPVDSSVERKYITGWRLYMLTFGLCLSLLLSTLETTVVSTSLFGISNALKRFDQAGWIVTSYLLTYTGFLIVFGKLSDIFGRKLMLLSAVVIFTVFSSVCGAVDSMLKLIIFRAFQGLGASGIYSLVSIISVEAVPFEKLGTYTGIISSVFALASVLGPVLGGAITDNTSWRWVFLINAPAGAAAIALVTVFLPLSFPYPKARQRSLRQILSRQSFKRIDYPGTFFSVAASVLLVFGLQEGGTVYSWKSAPIVSTFVISAVLWIGMVLWSRHLSVRNTEIPEPIIPWRILTSSKTGGILLIGFLTGFPFMSMIFILPQRFQAVNELAAAEAGYRLLPLLLVSPFAAAITGMLTTKLRIPPLYIVIAGLILQIISMALISVLPYSKEIPAQIYALEVILGFGNGFVLTSLIVAVAMYAGKADRAVALSAITQSRTLGGTIALAICSSLLLNHMRMNLSSFLSEEQISAVFRTTASIGMLPPGLQVETRRVIAEAYGLQTKIMTGFSGAALLATGLLWEKSPRRANPEDL